MGIDYILKECLNCIIHPLNRLSLYPHYSTYINIIIATLFFLGSALISTYVIIGNDKLVHKMIDHVMAKTNTEDQRMRAESASEKVEIALKTPGARILLSIKAAFLSCWSYFLLMIAICTVFALLIETPGFLKYYFKEALDLAIILSLGFIINAALKYIYLDHRITLSWNVIFEPSGERDPIVYLLNRLDLFTLYYITIVSVRISRVYKQNAYALTAVSVSCLIILSLFSYLTGMPFFTMQ